MARGPWPWPVALARGPRRAAGVKGRGGGGSLAIRRLQRWCERSDYRTAEEASGLLAVSLHYLVVAVAVALGPRPWTLALGPLMHTLLYSGGYRQGKGDVVEGGQSGRDGGYQWGCLRCEVAQWAHAPRGLLRAPKLA